MVLPIVKAGGEAELKIAENRSEYGSFKDSMRAPIHRWFMYPAGYSYKLIESKIREYKLGPSSVVLDPFVGCGTTSVVAKQMGVNSVGIEAHPFVFWVAKTKLFWEYDLNALSAAIEETALKASLQALEPSLQRIESGEFPALVQKCFSKGNLAKLLMLRETIAEACVFDEIKDFLKLALTHTLRAVSTAGTGWPYIAPSIYHGKTRERDAVKEFAIQARRMYDDVVTVRNRVTGALSTNHSLILGDARVPYSCLDESSVDFVITSPPYLNNYDYADRTRLEMYFFGLAHSWRDISETVRSKLVMAATTQVNRCQYSGNNLLSAEIKRASDDVYHELTSKINNLTKTRLQKGGKKSYDIMVAGYFNDMLAVIKQVHRVLKPEGAFVLVLGDSAPYGVPIPTDFYIGRLALGAGFESFQVELLRSRGGKWANNPQRHKMPLRETIVTIRK